jgi:hypothetical protein
VNPWCSISLASHLLDFYERQNTNIKLPIQFFLICHFLAYSEGMRRKSIPFFPLTREAPIKSYWGLGREKKRPAALRLVATARYQCEFATPQGAFFTAYSALMN